MNKNDTPSALNILNYISDFQNKAQSIKRFVGNPYVEGDNIAEHLSRLARLLICIAPDLKVEFPDNQNLIEEVLVTLLVHDDDEVIDGFDIPTAMKDHNVKDGEEIMKFDYSISNLSESAKEYLGKAFKSFRKKDSLSAKIAKALDNIAGNQLVIEQKIGLINPDQARFAIEYAEKVRGISTAIDVLVDAQINQIVDWRQKAKVDLDGVVVNLSKEKLMELLSVDVLAHVLDRARINVPLSELK
jgi:5'-deoxynucleotidase YfbR-like HD superfamily hydrolase